MPMPTNVVAEEAELRVLTSDELFAGSREIVILHNGVPYRLRVTRQNKLILTK
ncbi:MAG: hemin uptake protein HemP [Devosia sp.]|jgi:hemin uptake protein HemP|nr:hemin uptake protein HemP [Devosia sp.]